MRRLWILTFVRHSKMRWVSVDLLALNLSVWAVSKVVIHLQVLHHMAIGYVRFFQFLFVIL